jgi:hypothetical protein
MRRYKITALAKSIFADKTDWAVVDTQTGKRTGKYETAREARNAAKKLEME